MNKVTLVTDVTDNTLRRFGIFEADVRTGELRRNGVKVKLQEQPFRLLTVLLEKPGEVVTRQELRTRLWPLDTFVDFDHSLNSAVKRLREALGDSADSPRFVETVARRGYRFLAPVNGVSVNGAATDARKSSWIRNHLRLVATIAVLDVVGIVVGLSFGFHAGARSSQRLPRSTRLTSNAPDAPVFSAAISPDGRYLAYVDPRGIFVRPVASEESRTMPMPERTLVRSLSWFADGNSFLASGMAVTGEDSSLWRIPVLGGTPRKLVDDAALGSVSPDGRQIAFVRNMEFNHSDLWVADADGANSKKAATVAGWLTAAPAWSPDGRRLAFLTEAYWPGHGKVKKMTVELYDSATGATRLLFTDERLRGGLSWTRDGRLLLSMAESGPGQEDSNVWSLQLSAETGAPLGEPKRLTDGPDWNVVTNLSADGKRAIFIRNNIMPSVFVADIDPKGPELSNLQRLTMDQRPSLPYEWTPDNKAVLFRTHHEGKFHVFLQEPGAASAELLSADQDAVDFLRLNPDGSEVLYHTGQRSPNAGSQSGDPETFNVRIMRLPVRGGNESLLLEDKNITNFQCAHASSRECLLSIATKDGLNFFEFDSSTGAKHELLRISDPGWEEYNWSLSPNGETLALTKIVRNAEEASLRLKPLRGGQDRVLALRDCFNLVSLDWAADGRSLWASAVMRGEVRALINVDLQGRVKPVLQARPGTPQIGWGIPSRDGKRLALWQYTGGSNAWMLEGF